MVASTPTPPRLPSHSKIFWAFSVYNNGSTEEAHFRTANEKDGEMRLPLASFPGFPLAFISPAVEKSRGKPGRSSHVPDVL